MRVVVFNEIFWVYRFYCLKPWHKNKDSHCSLSRHRMNFSAPGLSNIGCFLLFAYNVLNKGKERYFHGLQSCLHEEGSPRRKTDYLSTFSVLMLITLNSNENETLFVFEYLMIGISLKIDQRGFKWALYANFWLKESIKVSRLKEPSTEKFVRRVLFEALFEQKFQKVV